MQIIGIICEYNPFHLGHKKQIDTIRAAYGNDCAIVCLMSGNYVQRGMPAVFDKSFRAQAALLSGADLVLELPITYALSSAEGFAAGGVRILSGFCSQICFGTETGTKESITATAQALLDPAFSPALRTELETGVSYPAARQAALERIGADASLLRSPNDILAVEYCKAILTQNSRMDILPILRQGSYHDTLPDSENPSATAVRSLIRNAQDWKPYIPETAQALFETAPIHTLSAAERAILYKLRTMSDAEFEALPYGAEGLWRRLMKASRNCASLEDILTAVKTKRYTRTRLDRMVMCAYLGITKEILSTPAPHVRVLAFNDSGKAVLKKARLTGSFPHIGDDVDHPYHALERRCDDLYGLFRQDSPDAPGQARARRVSIYLSP